MKTCPSTREPRAGPGRSRRRGSVLFLGLIVSIDLLAMVAAVSTSVTLGREAKYKIDRTQALAAAEGTTERAQKLILEQVSNSSLRA